VDSRGTSLSLPSFQNTCTLAGAVAAETPVMTKKTPVRTLPSPSQPASVMVDGFTWTVIVASAACAAWPPAPRTAYPSKTMKPSTPSNPAISDCLREPFRAWRGLRRGVSPD